MCVKKIISLILTVLLLCTYIHAVPAQASQQKFLANYSFNSFVTNDSPKALSVSGKNYRIYEYSKNDKGLLLNLSRAATEFTVPAETQGDFVVSFDIMAIGNGFSGSLTINSQDKSFSPLLVTEERIVTAHNQKRICGISEDNMTNITLVVKPAVKCYDIYVNGKCQVSDWYASGMQITGISELVFSFAAPESKPGIVIDNVNVYSGREISDKYPIDTYNEEILEIEEKKPVGDHIFINNDFTTGSLMNEKSKDNIMEVIKEADGNDCFHMKKTTTNDMFADQSIDGNEYRAFVLEFDLKLIDMKSGFHFLMFAGNGTWSTNGSLQNGTVMLCGKPVGKAVQSEWRHFAFAVDLDNELIDAYYNGKLVMEDVPYATPIGGPITLTRLRAQGNSNVCDILIDNYKIYEGTEPRELVEKELVKDPSKTVFPSEESEKALLEGKKALHVKSGVFYDGEKKTLVSPMPYIENGRTMVPVRLISESFGVDVSYDASTATIKLGDNVSFVADDYAVDINGEKIELDVPARVIDGRTFLPLRVLCEQILCKKVYYDDTVEYNEGLIVISDEEFKAPTDRTRLQALNDFVFYYRPTAEDVYALYTKNNPNNAHPRLQASKNTFDRLKEEIKKYPIKKKWADNIIALADSYLLSNTPPEYKTYDGVRLPSYSIGRTEVFGMAYQLTGDRKYVDAAWVQIEAVCNWPTWNPSHFLDVSNFLSGVATGYDWMYDAWTDEQKKIMEEGIFRNGLDEADNWYLGLKGSKTVFPMATNNWNTSCNGAVVRAALVFMEVYPEVCSRLISNGLRGVESMIYRYAPDGAWFEGTSYWGATTSAVGNLVDSLDTVLGDSFRLDRIGGLETTADFILQMQSPYGAYSFSDSENTHVYPDILYWLSNKYNNPSVTASTLRNTNSESSSPMALIWLNAEIQPNDITLPLDSVFRGDAQVASMRESWTDPETTYAAFKGGKTTVEHAHLDEGSFIFESMGERWSMDLGRDDYNIPTYWDMSSGRWKILRMRAEGHSTIIINPDKSGIDQALNTTADITSLVSKPRGSIGIVDMSGPLKKNAISARRGFFFTDNRKSLVIRDEISLAGEAELHWLMYTGAPEAEIGDKAITLMLNNKKLKLTFETNAKDYEIFFEDALPLEGSPVTAGENQNLGYRRVRIKLTGNGKVNMTVKLTPETIKGTDVSMYNKSIDLWTIPDGEVPENPKLDMIYADGKEIVDFDPINQQYVLKYFEPTSPMPNITAVSEGNIVNIENAENYDGTTVITVSNPNDSELATVYRITYKRDFSYLPTITPVSVSVSAQPQPENPKESAIDGNFATRWSAQGLTGHWIELDLGSVQDISAILMGTYEGNKRIFSFDISLSEDGETYYKVFDGKTDGITVDEYESFDIGNQKARYVKINCKGTTAGAWNSITELAVVKAQ